MKKVILLIVLLVIAIGSFALVQSGVIPISSSTNPITPLTPEPVDSKEPIRALGRLEPAQGVISVSGMVGDRLAELLVAEGEVVQPKQELARLASYPLRELEVRALEVELEQARRQKDSKLKVAEAQVSKAELVLKQAQQQGLQAAAQQMQIDLLTRSLNVEQRNLERLQGAPEELVSLQEREKQELLIEKVRTELAAAEASQQQLNFQKEVAEKDLASAEVQVQTIAETSFESIEAQLELARRRRDDSIVRAPANSNADVEYTVLKIHTYEGETIGPHPILQLADLSDMVCIAEVYKTEVKKLRKGMNAIITSKAFSVNELSGKVAGVDRIISSAKLRSPNPLATVDPQVVNVRIALDDAPPAEAAGENTLTRPEDLINLPVEVELGPE